jgi:hypothetical protein
MDSNNKIICRTIALGATRDSQQIDLLSCEVCILLPDRRAFRKRLNLLDVSNDYRAFNNFCPNIVPFWNPCISARFWPLLTGKGDLESSEPDLPD